MKRVVSSHKAQAAMEFMMTYGWVMMAVIISIAALYYFGVFDYKGGTEACILSPGIGCKNFVIGSNGVSLELTNGLGSDVNNVVVTLTNLPSGVTCGSSSSQSLSEGSKGVFSVSCNNLANVKNIKSSILVTYVPSGATLSKTASGIINGKISSTQITGLTINIVSNPVVSNITADSATISWSTTLTSISDTIRYGTSSGVYGLSMSATNGLSHSATLIGLSPSTTYYYVVNSTASNSSAQSSESSFTTSAGSDTQAPSFSNPTRTPSTVYNGNTVRFNMTITDNVQLAGYRLSINQGAGYVNQTYVNIGGTSVVGSQTVTITASAGTTVYWFYIANDTNSNIASSSIQSFVVSSAASCSGTPNDCYSMYDEYSCQVVSGCNWCEDIPPGTCFEAGCSGFAYACNTYSSQTTCLDAGCTWS